MIFQGIKVAICGVAESVRAERLSALVSSNGGTVERVVRPVAAVFAKARKPVPLPEDVTHVLVGNKIGTLADLYISVNSNTIPAESRVLKVEWVSDSVSAGTALPDETYRLDLIISNAPRVNERDEGRELREDGGSLKRARHESAESGSHDSTTTASSGGAAFPWRTAPMGDGWDLIYPTTGGPASALCRIQRDRREYSEVVAFDLDGTLIQTKSGAKFATNHNDWKFFHASVPTKLRSLHEEGKYVAIVSNQGGVGKFKNLTVDSLKRKLTLISEAIGCPVDIICSFLKDDFRKPGIASWRYLNSRSIASSASISRTLYVGDAAGRPAHKGRPKDFASTDLDYALSIQAEVAVSFVFCALNS